jgi:hypothetical protein
VKQGIIRRVMRESRKLLEQRQVQLKQPEQLLERNAEIARGIPGNHRRQSEESALRSVTDRVSLRCEEQRTQNLLRETLGKRSRIIKSQTNAKKIAQRRKMKRWNIVKEKLLMLFERFVLFARDVGRNRANENQDRIIPHFAWPHVMNSFATMRGPIAWRTWIWNHQHSRWHHGYYRTHR